MEQLGELAPSRQESLAQVLPKTRGIFCQWKLMAFEAGKKIRWRGQYLSLGVLQFKCRHCTRVKR